ncbi:hypothetical protein ALC60_07771, partial [Trachymyrmex zeteki]
LRKRRRAVRGYRPSLPPLLPRFARSLPVCGVPSRSPYAALRNADSQGSKPTKPTPKKRKRPGENKRAGRAGARAVPRRLHHHRPFTPSPLLHPFALFLSTEHHTDDHRCCLKEPTPGKSR